MSNRYRSVAVAQIQNLADMMQEGLAKLMKADPNLAKKLMGVDFAELTSYLLVESLKQLAKQSRARFIKKEKDLSQGYFALEELPGRFLGAIEQGNDRLVLMSIETGVQCIKQINSHYVRETCSAHLDELEAKFNEIYRGQSMVAVARLLSGNKVEVEQQGDILTCDFEREV